MVIRAITLKIWRVDVVAQNAGIKDLPEAESL